MVRCKKITKFISGYHSRPLLVVGLEGVLGITTVVVVQELGELTVAHLRYIHGKTYLQEMN